MIMRHLLWKEMKAVKPLVAAIVFGTVGIFLALMLVAAAAMTPTGSTSMFVSFWILMPNLVALGAPAMLVGSEEENGTLGWLRTLPLRWQQIADSKFLVAVGAVAIAWIVSSALMFLSTLFAAMGLDPSQGNSFTPATAQTPFVQDVTSPSGILFLLFFSLLLLLSGFITAYTFRSPVAGLIAVVPLIAVVNAAAHECGRWMLTGHLHYEGAAYQVQAWRYAWVAASALLLLFALWAIQRLLARRRMTSPYTNRLRNVVPVETASAYRPPVLVRVSRPNSAIALLWQHLRQAGPLAAALTLTVSGFLVLMLAPDHVRGDGFWTFVAQLAPLFIATGSSWLGGLAFYGDNVRKRVAFFADRGISPTRIWWTRLLLPSVCCLILVTIAMTMRDQWTQPLSGQAVVILVTFAFGVLIGQWIERPVLTFFMAPAAAAIASILLFIVYAFYANYHWTAVLVLPVLLFASWRLSQRWLFLRIDAGYHWRAFGYAALSVVIPIVSVIAIRIATTPAAMPRWRQTMVAVTTPDIRTQSTGRLVQSRNISPDAFSAMGLAEAFKRASTEEKQTLLDQELASERIGDHVSLDDIRTLLVLDPGDQPPLQRTAIAVLLKWARQVREGVLEGNYWLADLDRAAEQSEGLAVSALQSHVAKFGPTPELAELARSVPDADLRRNSRRVALIDEWKTFHGMSWSQQFPDHTHFGKTFANHPVAYRVAKLPLERTRAERFIDQLTRLLLRQIDSGLPESILSPDILKRNELWEEACGPIHRGPNPLPIGRTWTRDYEQSIERLQARF